MPSPEWVSLFDTGEMEHVVRLVNDEDRAVVDGLRSVLLTMLDAYCQDKYKGSMTIDIEAANELRVVALEIAQSIENDAIDEMKFFSVEGSDDPEEQAAQNELWRRSGWESRAKTLKDAWTKFIAAGAGYLQYSEIPKQREARAKGAQAKASKQREVINKAIKRFDPGPDSGLSDSRRAEIILSRAQAAKAKGEFAEADRLPKALRRHLR